jgi:hypothetical protein
MGWGRGKKTTSLHSHFSLIFSCFPPSIFIMLSVEAEVHQSKLESNALLSGVMQQAQAWQVLGFDK